jgi:hypothetical protein
MYQILSGFLVGCWGMRLSLFLLALSAAVAQDTVPPPELNAVEKQFQESLNSVTMIGYFTVGDSKELHDDRYVIERVSKVAEGTWSFDARVQYNQKDFKVTIKVPVKFAGDTPVISLTRTTVPGMGMYDARVIFYQGAYAGTWGAGDHGGTMFGKLVKNEPAH